MSLQGWPESIFLFDDAAEFTHPAAFLWEYVWAGTSKMASSTSSPPLSLTILQSGLDFYHGGEAPWVEVEAATFSCWKQIRRPTQISSDMK